MPQNKSKGTQKGCKDSASILINQQIYKHSVFLPQLWDGFIGTEFLQVTFLERGKTRENCFQKQKKFFRLKNCHQEQAARKTSDRLQQKKNCLTLFFLHSLSKKIVSPLCNHLDSLGVTRQRRTGNDSLVIKLLWESYTNKILKCFNNVILVPDI